MAKDEKRFDAVRMMRTIRRQIAEETEGMTFEELQAYIRKRLHPEGGDRADVEENGGAPPTSRRRAG